jgi:hypothetical protein
MIVCCIFSTKALSSRSEEEGQMVYEFETRFKIKRRMGNDLKKQILVHNGIIPEESAAAQRKLSVLSCARCSLVNINKWFDLTSKYWFSIW